MQLFHSPASPFVRKVMTVLHETNQLGDVRVIDVTTTPLASDGGLLAANPLGKIPALQRDGAPTLFDSRVICRFLDDRAQAGLYPQEQLWEVLSYEALADGMMEAAVGMVYEKRFRPEDKVSEPWIDAQWAKVAQALDMLEMKDMSGPVDMGQIAIACALGYLDFRHDARDWRDGHEALATWYDSFAKRPAMLATAPVG